MPDLSIVGTAPFAVPGYSGEGGQRKDNREVGSAVPVSDTDFIVYSPNYTFTSTGDHLGVARLHIAGDGTLSSVWSGVRALTWSNGFLKVLARAVVGDQFVVLTGGRGSFGGSQQFKMYSYNLSDGNVTSELDVTFPSWSGGGFSLHAYSTTAAWLFWSDDDGAFADTCRVFAQTVTIAGGLTAGDPVTLATYHATVGIGHGLFLDPIPSPMYPVTLADGVCGLYVWVNSGYPGTFLEIHDSGGSASVTNTFDVSDGGNGTNTNVVRTDSGIGFTWFNDSRSSGGAYVFGTINWSSGAGFSGYTVQRESGYSLNHEPEDQYIQGVETTLAGQGKYLGDAYAVEAVGGGDPTITLNLHDFTTAPTDLTPGAATATASLTIPAVVRPYAHNDGSLATREVRTTPVGTGWYVLVWGASTGPYTLIAKLGTTVVPDNWWLDPNNAAGHPKGQHVHFYGMT